MRMRTPTFALQRLTHALAHGLSAACCLRTPSRLQVQRREKVSRTTCRLVRDLASVRAGAPMPLVPGTAAPSYPPPPGETCLGSQLRPACVRPAKHSSVTATSGGTSLFLAQGVAQGVAQGWPSLLEFSRASSRWSVSPAVPCSMGLAACFLQ